MGFVLIGIYSFNQIALQGVIIQMVAHGISAAGLLIMSGQLYERLHTREMGQMGGFYGRMKNFPPIAMFFGAASLGLPGLGNFVGEFLILIGTYQVNQLVTFFAASGLVLAAAYSLIMIQRTLHGAPKDTTPIADLSWRELSMMLSLMAVLVWVGLFPQAILDTSAAVTAGVQQAVAAVPALVH